MPRDTNFDPMELLPKWYKQEKKLALMLPYVSLVDDNTIRTKGNEFFQCIRLEGLNSNTIDDQRLEKIRSVFASLIARVGTEFSYYVHKVSKNIEPALERLEAEDFASLVDARWQSHLNSEALRDKTLTLTVIHRPSLGQKIPFRASKSRAALREQKEKRLRRLGEVVGFLMASFDTMRPHLLSAKSGELLGFLGSLNTGQEWPILPGSQLGVLAENVANTRVSFHDETFTVSEGPTGLRYGTTFAVKKYPEQTICTMFDDLNLPIDMVVTHSFTPINNNLMSERIKRQRRQMKAADDGAESLREALKKALDDVESDRLCFGDHHMTVTVFADDLKTLELIAGEIRNIGLSSGVTLLNEKFAARAHFFAQHPGNSAARSRKANVTCVNFADFAAFHRTQLGKPGNQVPWGKPITMFPTPELSGFWFNYHEEGSPDKEPTGGHTLIFGRPGSGKSVLSAFLATQSRRCDTRVFVFDYRMGMEMAVRANGGTYASIRAGEPTGLNPLRTEIDERGQAWLSDWLSRLVERDDRPLNAEQVNRIQEVVRQNANASDDELRNWGDMSSLLQSVDDSGDLFDRFQEWTDGGRYGWIFGQSAEDTFSLDGDVVGFDLTDILDSESEKERMAVLSYLFRRIERVLEDRKPTIIIIDEAWKALDNPYFAEKLSNWLVTARKQNAVVVMMTQYPSQLENTRTGKTIIEAVPTQVLLPNIRASESDYALLKLEHKELDLLLNTGSGSRLGLVRDDQGSVVIDANLSALGPLLTILGGMEKGEQLVGADYRQREDFWRVS